eukprot:9834848-Lingulodinium_polyedra.AAC.1
MSATMRCWGPERPAPCRRRLCGRGRPKGHARTRPGRPRCLAGPTNPGHILAGHDLERPAPIRLLERGRRSPEQRHDESVA